jgi:hypothetical protein
MRKERNACFVCHHDAMDTVWLLWFEQEREGDDDTELLIGVYRTEGDANAAVERLKGQPGFRDYPEGFRAYQHVLGEDSWTEVFARV